MTLANRLSRAVRNVPDFPARGVQFKDITPVLAEPRLFRDVIGAMTTGLADCDLSHVVGVESRGFLFAVPVALSLGVSFVPVRKPGKLPRLVEREAYTLEYGESVLEMHTDALTTLLGGRVPRVAVIDDVLATGETAAATCRLVERLGGEVGVVSVVIELAALAGRKALEGRAIQSLLTY